MPTTPYYRRWVSDYVADTVHLSLEEDGLYCRMLDAMWIYRGLPLGIADQAKLLRVQIRTYRRLLGLNPTTEIVPKLDQDTGRIHPELCEQDRDGKKFPGSFAETSPKHLRNFFLSFTVIEGRLWHNKMYKEYENSLKRIEKAKKAASASHKK